MDKLVEKIVRVIKRETNFTEGKYSPLAGPITSDVREMDCDPTYLAKQIKRAILSSPNIVKIDPDAEFPKSPYHYYSKRERTQREQEESFCDIGYHRAVGDIRRANWVKPK